MLELTAPVLEGLSHARSKYDTSFLLFKTFEKAKLETPKLKSLAWSLFIVAKGASTV